MRILKNYNTKIPVGGAFTKKVANLIKDEFGLDGIQTIAIYQDDEYGYPFVLEVEGIEIQEEVIIKRFKEFAEAYNKSQASAKALESRPAAN